MNTIPNTPNAAERPSDAAILQWLLDHSYLNNGLIDYGAGFTQQRPGIIKGALIDTMNGWHGECQFCRGGQELYADGNPSGEACSHCKGKGNVNELRADDIFYYYEAIAELDSHRPAESVSAEPVAVPGAVWIYGSVSLVAHGSEEEWVRKRNAARLYLHPLPSTPGAVSDDDVGLRLLTAAFTADDVKVFQAALRNAGAHCVPAVRTIESAFEELLESFAKRSAAANGDRHG